ncbi:MAG: complex I NDUFA9 subunit family protein, partial [Methyloligellaceae bacterium]
HLVRVLAREGYRIRVAVRRPELAQHLQPLGSVGQVHAVQANINDKASVQHAVIGADHVINLTGILFQSGKQSFRNIHHNGARTVAEAARLEGAKSFVHVSAIGASLKSGSRYAKTKALGEKAVLEEFPAAVILRPSVIFGPEDQFFNKFAEMALYSPALPLIGGGKTKLQPVYVGDVAMAILHAMSGRADKGKIYELGGPQIMTLKEVMRKTLEFSDRKRLLLWVPSVVAKWLMAPFLSVLPKPPLTMDQVTQLGYHNTVSQEAEEEGRTLESLGVNSNNTVDAIVPEYLERFRPHGQFSGLRL